MMVTLDLPPPPVNSPSAVPVQARTKFRKECLEVLSGVPDQAMALGQLPAAFSKHFGRSFVLADYGAKKLLQLAQSIPHTVKVLYRSQLICGALVV